VWTVLIYFVVNLDLCGQGRGQVLTNSVSAPDKIRSVKRIILKKIHTGTCRYCTVSKSGLRSDSFHRQHVQRLAGLSCKRELTRVSFPLAYRTSTVSVYFFPREGAWGFYVNKIGQLLIVCYLYTVMD
jgi:hypothetical protein